MANRLVNRLFKTNSFVRKIVVWNRDRVDRRRHRQKAQDSARYDHRLGVLAIMKNEGRNIEEWVEHYLWQGAGKIFIIDNGSTDNGVDLLAPWIATGQVEVISLTDKWRQREHYWTAVKTFRIRQTCQWLLLADLDEFWFCKDRSTVAEALNGYDKIDVIYCNWRVFGSDGHITHPSSLRIGIVKRQPEYAPHFLTKWICRTSALRRPANLHIHKIHGVCSSRVITDTEAFQLNHYPTQSVEFFQDVKMTRGDVLNPIQDGVRDMEFFRHIDSFCTHEDTLLAQQVIARRN